MIITWSNYKSVLPESLWHAFERLANKPRAQYNPIIFTDGMVRFANADEI